jgi:hypothetical protein
MQKSLNDITEADLQEVKALAELFFTPAEIALMLEIKYAEVKEEIESEEGSFYESFQCGRLQSEMELRKSILMLAKAGSSPAQTMSLDLLNKSKAKMLDL